MRATLQHYLNGPHVFCRLRDLGFSCKVAGRITQVYENLIHRFLYKGGEDDQR